METVEHFTRIDPEEEWKRGWLGFATKLRGIAAWAVGDTAATTLAFWHTHWVIGVVAIAVGLIGVVFLLLIRHYRMQRVKTDNCLHEICHKTRDDVAKILSSDPKEVATNVMQLEQFHEHTAQRVVEFFKELTGDKTIGCAIRMAEIVDGTQGWELGFRSSSQEFRSNSQRQRTGWCVKIT